MIVRKLTIRLLLLVLGDGAGEHFRGQVCAMIAAVAVKRCEYPLHRFLIRVDGRLFELHDQLDEGCNSNGDAVAWPEIRVKRLLSIQQFTGSLACPIRNIVHGVMIQTEVKMMIARGRTAAMQRRKSWRSRSVIWSGITTSSPFNHRIGNVVAKTAWITCIKKRHRN
ncbi:hypothetical protein Saro_3020 [Novosphingobium aromaticivorans DSM 12444]|uniref:Uncharacterized protein n=1 Tax=Novosphingobium aromaticivorans (strain ATCC 700278 / DSM 12444 / CCUG 56034 / CIP 105152 / NBRC 16084 / F199) TaxID=279238 RepID=Q2G3W8_NOVAD|nr:hypothetical protein Saro_3020 [Novosphingobium aromaticivorans DSM 12444]